VNIPAEFDRVFLAETYQNLEREFPNKLVALFESLLGCIPQEKREKDRDSQRIRALFDVAKNRLLTVWGEHILTGYKWQIRQFFCSTLLSASGPGCRDIMRNEALNFVKAHGNKLLLYIRDYQIKEVYPRLLEEFYKITTTLCHEMEQDLYSHIKLTTKDAGFEQLIKKFNAIVKVESTEHSKIYKLTSNKSLRSTFNWAMKIGEEKKVENYFSEHQKRLQERIKEWGFTETKDVRSDGNCLFDALASQILGNATPQNSQDMRSSIVAYLRRNQHLFVTAMATAYGYNDWQDMCDKMEKNGEWGNEVILRAAANLFCRDIIVISSTSDAQYTLKIATDSRSGVLFPPIVLGHIVEFHFYSLK